MRARRLLPWIVAGLGLILLGVGFARWGSPLVGLLRDRAAYQGWLASFGVWAPLVSIGVNAAQVILAPLPGQAISMANGYLFGIGWGTVYNLAGSMLGTAIILVATRRWGQPLVERLVRDHAQMALLDRLVMQRGKLFFFLLFVLPFTPKDLACYAVGLTRLPIGPMLVLIALGRLPGLLVAGWFGAHATQLTTTEWAVLIVAASAAGLAYLRWGSRLEALILRGADRLAGRTRDRSP